MTMERHSGAGGGVVVLEAPGCSGQGTGFGGGAGRGNAGRGEGSNGGGGGGRGGDGGGGGGDNIPQPPPLPPIICRVPLPLLTQLKAAFVNIGFSEAGARMLAHPMAKTLPLNRSPSWMTRKSRPYARQCISQVEADRGHTCQHELRL
jgi:hypothetical protein